MSFQINLARHDAVMCVRDQVQPPLELPGKCVGDVTHTKHTPVFWVCLPIKRTVLLQHDAGRASWPRMTNAIASALS